jgi:hypothetical protein
LELNNLDSKEKFNTFNIEKKKYFESEFCVICFENQPVYKFIPCSHKCICEECINSLIEKDENLNVCFICNQMINYREKDFIQYTKQMSSEEFKKEAYFFTISELLKIKKL